MRANDAIKSPAAIAGKYLAFCSGVPSITIPCEPIPTVVPITDRNAGDVLHNSMTTKTSSSMVSPSPPNSSGILIPNKPSSFISLMMSCGISSVSDTSASAGTRRLRTKLATPSVKALIISGSLIIFLFSVTRSDYV